MNRPQLRFPEFEGEWEKKKFEDVIISIESGTSVNSIDQPILNKLQYGILKTSCISKGEFFPNENKTIIDSEISRATLSPLKDSILVSRMNTPQLVGENGYIDKDYPNLFTPDRLWLLKTFPNYSARFLNYILTTSNIRTIISNIATGTSNSMKNISQPNFLSIESYFPIKPEQTKIASFLTAVDEKIQALKKKHHLLEQYKKGVMQKLFSQEIRFKDKSGEDFPEWEVKKLGEVCEKKSSNISANKIVYNFGDYIIYGAAGVLKKVDFYEEEKDYVSIIKDGAGVGRIVYCVGKSSVLSTMDIIKPKIKLNTYFLYCLLENIDFTKYITGSTIPHIYFKDYRNELCGIPSLPEQTAIANFLSNLDEKINQTQRQIEKTEMWKKGLLQKMFC